MPILDAVEQAGSKVEKWKFYQYMSYDDVPRDHAHAVPATAFHRCSSAIAAALAARAVEVHFKDNSEMNGSLFNILPYGNAQYMRPGDSWTTTRRTPDLRSYATMADLFRHTGIDAQTFHKFHGLPNDGRIEECR